MVLNLLVYDLKTNNFYSKTNKYPIFGIKKPHPLRCDYYFLIISIKSFETYTINVFIIIKF